MNNEIYHHGIKGQKWGIRRFQNKDGSLTQLGKQRIKGAKWKSDLVWDQFKKDVKPGKFLRKPAEDKELYLKKGSKVTHVTPADFKKLRKGQDLYVSGTETDKDMYRAYLSMMLKNKGYGKDTPIKEVIFDLKKDLKAPSNKNQKKIFDEVYAKNKELFDQDLDNYYVKHKRPKLDTPDNNYEAFIKSLDSSGESKKIFYDALKSKGYNAVLDSHDIDHSWMNAERPLIVMDALNTFGNMEVKNITDGDIQNTLKKLGVL